jgi:hypothetical protein
MSPSWYVVKYNWEETDQFCREHLNCEHIGLGGDIWPQEFGVIRPACYLELKKVGESLRFYELDDGQYIQVCPDLQAAQALWEGLRRQQPANDPLLLELSTEELGQHQGYDFGSPEGGYSLIESEITAYPQRTWALSYLNSHGLFADVEAIRAFIERLEEEGVEDLDSYKPISIRRVL